MNIERIKHEIEMKKLSNLQISARQGQGGIGGGGHAEQYL